MQDFRRLNVWEKAHLLVLDVYKITSQFPAEERFGLTSQLRRAAASIPTNIAEGCGRSGAADYAKFLQIAFGSAGEVDYLLILTKDLDYLTENDYQRLSSQTAETKRMLASLIQKIRARP